MFGLQPPRHISTLPNPVLSRAEIPQCSSPHCTELCYSSSARELVAVRRREFITLLGGSAVAWPLTGRAQQPAMPSIGFLRSTSADDTPQMLVAFRDGLQSSGTLIAPEWLFLKDSFD